MSDSENKSGARNWMLLDNAAKIYTASMRSDWTALFRVSAELTETVDPVILKKAQESTLKRFPSISVRLKRGLFWYYLEHNDEDAYIQHDVANPCVRMKLKENNGFMFRVRCFEKRIAVEFFHVLTDGTGGITFLKTLTAEYLRLKYGAVIPRGNGVLDCGEQAKTTETEDSFMRYAGGVRRSRSEADSFYWNGMEEPTEIIHITTGIIPISDLTKRAKEKGATLTEYLAAVMILSLDKLQKNKIKNVKRLKQVKVLVPVNLRALFPSETLRNFTNYVAPGIDPRYGEYSLDEVINAVKHHMGSEITEKLMRAKISTNVADEKNPILRLVPLFVKDLAMRAAFNVVGDRKTSTCISNLGLQKLPQEMEKYVERMDFILGPLSRTKVACGVVGYKDKLYFNFTRTIKQTDLEREFFTRLVKLGVHVKVESNRGSLEGD